jgi:hypothetical protein
MLTQAFGGSLARKGKIQEATECLLAGSDEKVVLPISILFQASSVCSP